MPNRVSLLVAALLLGGAGERPVRVQAVAMVSAGTMMVAGTVQARTQADLAFRVGGKVINRPVEVGDHVRAGQMLAVLDPADLQFAVESAEAALSGAEADSANAAAELRRYEALGRASPAYLPSEYDKRSAAMRMAGARLIQAQRQTSLARDQHAYGTLTADADGIVTALPVQVGQVVSAGQTVATVAHSAAIEVVADVPENRLTLARTASDVAITLWAIPDTVLHGHVREVGALADPASRTFATRITILDAPPGLLALGMTATVSFGGGAAPVAVLPAASLTDREGHPAVWVLDPATHRATLRSVELAGYGGDGTVMVRAGLTDGEQVVTAGARQVDATMPLVAWAGAAR